MRTVTRAVAVATVAAALAAGCEDTATPAPTSTAAPREPDTAVRVVNLNAAMGFKMAAGDSGGTDATEEDIGFLADDILGQRGDVANLQEMALPAARSLRAVLAERTGDEWQLNWAHSGTATYYPGRDDGERPTPGYENVSAGNAQLVRIGDGVRRQRPITVDDRDGDQGIMLPSGGRSFVGAELTTERGPVDVYVTHLALADQVSDEARAADVLRVQEVTESRANPAVITGDFNQTIDFVRGQPYPNHRTVDALRSFMERYGYTDVARDKGPTSNEKRKVLGPKRIDYVLARGVRTADTVRFVSHESDHWGLATTIEAAADPPSSIPAAPTTTTTTEPTTTPTATPAEPTTAEPTTGNAIQRYELFLHAIGAEDVATVCEVAGPAAKKAEDDGFGPCEQTIPVMFAMMSPEQKQALRTATVDPAQVTVRGAAVAIPASAIRAAVPFTASDLGDAVLEHLDGQWYVTD